jgi:hypothetical protein
MGLFTFRINTLLALEAWGTTAPPVNQKPSVSFSPNDSSTPTVGVVKTYLALATDQDGSVAGVELLQVQGVPAQGQDPVVVAGLASDATSPYSLDWTPTAAGTVYLAARATDNQGTQGYSSVLAVTVQAASGGYDTPLVIDSSGNSQAAYGVRFSALPGTKLEFNRQADTGQLPVHADVLESGSAIAGLDFTSNYVGSPFRLTTSSGTVYQGTGNTFQNGTITLS